MPVFQGKVNAGMTGNAPPTRHENPRRPVPAIPVAAAGIDFPGLRVRPREGMQRMIRGKLLVPRLLLPGTRLGGSLESENLFRQVPLRLRGQLARV